MVTRYNIDFKSKSLFPILSIFNRANNIFNITSRKKSSFGLLPATSALSMFFFATLIFLLPASEDANVSHTTYLFFPQYALGSESNSDSSETTRIPRLASGLPTEQLCVECLSSKNVISGQGLVVGTNFLDYIVGSTFNDIIFSKTQSERI